MKRILVFLILMTAPLRAQYVTAISPQFDQQFFDNNGNPCALCTITSYQAGTTTPLLTYTTHDLSAANQNPLTLSSSGRASVWLLPRAYKLVLKSAVGATIRTVDYVVDTGSLLHSDLANTTDTALNSSLVGFKLPAGVATTVRQKLIDLSTSTVYVTDFGAVCDGTTNDWQAFTDALAFSGRGVRVMVPPGVCKLNDTLTAANPFTLVGASNGNNSSDAGSVLLFAANKTGISLPSNLAERSVVENLYLKSAGGTTGSGISVNSNSVILRNIYIDGFPEDGVLTDTVSSGANANSGRYEQVRVKNVGRDGFRTKGLDSNQILFDHPSVQDAGGYCYNTTYDGTNYTFNHVFLGPHAQNCTGGDYYENGSDNQYVNPYCEPGTGFSFTYGPQAQYSIIFGGQTALNSCPVTENAAYSPNFIFQKDRVRGQWFITNGQGNAAPKLVLEDLQGGGKTFLIKNGQASVGAFEIENSTDSQNALEYYPSAGTRFPVDVRVYGTNKLFAVAVGTDAADNRFLVDATNNTSYFLGSTSQGPRVALTDNTATTGRIYDLTNGRTAAGKLALVDSGVAGVGGDGNIWTYDPTNHMFVMARPFQPVPLAFASLPASPVNGMLIYCTDCVINATCAGSGTGAFAKRLNGAWVCN